jgi:hypothetical protein
MCPACRRRDRRGQVRDRVRYERWRCAAEMQVYSLGEGVQGKGIRSGVSFAAQHSSWGQRERLASYANVKRESAAI